MWRPPQIVVSTIEHGRPQSQVYCDDCWRVIRHGAATVMLEGPVVWGESWDEVEKWLTRALAANPSRLYRRLLAAEIHRQIPHLPAPAPPSVGRFLSEFGEAAG